MVVGLALALVITTAPKPCFGHQNKGPQDQELPPVPARLWIIAPSAQGSWILRIDNESDEAIRIPADVRLLRFTVRPLKNKRWVSRPVICDGPRAFGLQRRFPARRALLLRPGYSYVERFDPRLFCFGKKAKAIAGGSLIKASYGWPERPRWSKRPERPPFVAESTKLPRKYRPLRQLKSPTLLLSYMAPQPEADSVETAETADRPVGPTAAPIGAAGDDPYDGADEGKDEANTSATPGNTTTPSSAKPISKTPAVLPRVVDELAPRFALTASRYADAAHARNIIVSVQTHNAGKRSAPVVLRRRQFSFKVFGPNGRTLCRRSTADHTVPPDHFRTLRHGKHIHLRVLLAELCPHGTFNRPGLYWAVPKLFADESGSDFGIRAMTGVAKVTDEGPVSGTHRESDDATLIRVRSGSGHFYRRRPHGIPTRLLP